MSSKDGGREAEFKKRSENGKHSEDKMSTSELKLRSRRAGEQHSEVLRSLFHIFSLFKINTDVF